MIDPRDVVTDRARSWQDDLALDPAITFPRSARAGEPRAMFLTGATGLLGAFVLRELLRSTTADVHCLVRATSQAAAASRLETHLAPLGLADPAAAPRIVPVAGDLGLPDFGLPRERFAALADTVDVIYHCGVLADFWRPYAALRATNVLGTAEVLRLAGTGATKPVHHASTLAVFFDQVARGAAQVSERDAATPSDGLQSGYVRSKHVAEQLVLAAAQRGLPASIYRTSRLGGDSRTGATSNTKDLIASLLKACVVLAAYPDLRFDVALAPVDWVSAALVSLSRRPDGAGQALHLFQPRPIAWPALISMVQACGYPLTAMTFDAWRTRLKQTAAAGHREREALARLWMVLGADHTLLAPRPRHETPSSGPHLEAAGLRCPPIDAGQVERYVAFFQRSGFLPAPAQNA
jgi:myxalamid-type nonribosomal peptide synthetase MxaA